MSPRPRRVRCARCGEEAVLPHDQPGVAVQLPHNWRRVAQRADGSPVIFCPACLKETGPANDGAEP
jgi:hypothetical protein